MYKVNALRVPLIGNGSKRPMLQEIPMVRDFFDVFPDDLLVLPLDRGLIHYRFVARHTTHFQGFILDGEVRITRAEQTAIGVIG